MLIIQCSIAVRTVLLEYYGFFLKNIPLRSICRLSRPIILVPKQKKKHKV